MANEKKEKIYLYTDGACSGNPGRGGFGAILIYGAHQKKISEGFQLTTNNRMELLAVIKGLEAIKIPGSEVIVVSDSKYVVDAVMQGWLFDWEKKNWKKVKNPDLWQRFLPLYKKHHVKFEWVKAHNNHTYNELCDEMAVAAYHSSPLLIDKGYKT